MKTLFSIAARKTSPSPAGAFIRVNNNDSNPSPGWDRRVC